MTDDEFEWDDDKAASNLRKHGVSFVAARLVFQDAFAIEDPEPQIQEGETRFITVGIAGGQILYVVYTERESRVRIISARKANRREQDGYYSNQTPQ
jgi:hypothetical protein